MSTNDNQQQHHHHHQPPPPPIQQHQQVASSASSPTHPCICSSNTGRVPRPRNAFILYRQHHHSLVVADNPGKSNPEISKIIGEQWRSLPQREKDFWIQLGDEEKKSHLERFPDYRYQPRRSSKRSSNITNGTITSQTGGTIMTNDSGICPVCKGITNYSGNVVSSGGPNSSNASSQTVANTPAGVTVANTGYEYPMYHQYPPPLMHLQYRLPAPPPPPHVLTSPHSSHSTPHLFHHYDPQQQQRHHDIIKHHSTSAIETVRNFSNSSSSSSARSGSTYTNRSSMTSLETPTSTYLPRILPRDEIHHQSDHQSPIATPIGTPPPQTSTTTRNLHSPSQPPWPFSAPSSIPNSSAHSPHRKVHHHLQFHLQLHFHNHYKVLHYHHLLLRYQVQSRFYKTKSLNQKRGECRHIMIH